METVLKKAMSGQRESVLELYEMYKKKVYFLCQSLLKDPQEVDFVFIDSFKEVWKVAPQKSLESCDEFEELLLRIVIKNCQNSLFNGEPHIFKERKPQDFKQEDVSQKEATISYKEALNDLNQLEEAESFIMKSYLISSLPKRMLAQTLRIEEMDLEAYILDAMAQCEQYEQFQSALEKYDVDIPQTTNTNCSQYIESITKPEKKSKVWIPILCIVLAIGGFLGYYFFAPSPQYIAKIEVYDYGTITVELNSEQAPKTVKNFVQLAQNGFYDGLTFHRIMDGFMMQGGDPNGDGTGGSDETIPGEFSDNGHPNNISHVRGTISMARSQDPDSASSQFFIVQSDSTFLDGQYAAFGKVTSGMDIVDKICKEATPYDDNGSIYPEEQPIITGITIEKKK